MTVLNYIDLCVELMDLLMIISVLKIVLELLNKQMGNAQVYCQDVNTVPKYSCQHVVKMVLLIETCVK